MSRITSSTRSANNETQIEIYNDNAIEGEIVSEISTREVARNDVIEMLLRSKKSQNTKDAYKSDLRKFFGEGYTMREVGEFLSLEVPDIALRLNQYKITMQERGDADATINRRLAAVRSLLKYSFRLGWCDTDGRGLVDSETVQSYRDTRGLELPQLLQVLEEPSRKYETGSVAQLRDTAILRLLCENGFRRGEAHLINVGDFSLTGRRVMILGKGRSQKEPCTISKKTAKMLAEYLIASGHSDDLKGALFRNLDHRPSTRGGRLSGQAIYYIVRGYGRRCGVGHLTPHKLRHSAATLFLEAGGDIRDAQKLMRHKDIKTTMIYDDNRKDGAGVAVNLLSELFDGKTPKRKK